MHILGNRRFRETTALRWLLLCGIAAGVPAHARSGAVDAPMVTVRGPMWGIAPRAEPAAFALAATDGAAASIGSPVDGALPDPATAPLLPSYGPTQPIEAAADDRRISFGRQVRSVGWEVGAFATYVTVINLAKIHHVGSAPFHFQDEGFFGKSTYNLGIDKFAHAFDTYVLAEALRARIDRKTGAAPGSAVTAAVLASGLMIYGEIYDGLKTSAGFSFQDVLFNTGGAAFSVLRHEVPGLKDKLDFRVLVVPNSDIFTFDGQRHFAQQRYLLALQLSGFERFRSSPLRFLDLQLGYSATGFTPKERARGEVPKRKPFIGVGLDLGELFFKSPTSRVARAAGSVLDYVQPPYTSLQLR